MALVWRAESELVLCRRKRRRRKRIIMQSVPAPWTEAEDFSGP